MTIKVTAIGQTDGVALFVDAEEAVWKEPTIAIPVVTNASPGLMSAAEHTKLAGVAVGANTAGPVGDAFAMSHVIAFAHESIATAIQPEDNVTELGSGAATSGQVPIANGSGSIAWGDQSGVTLLVGDARYAPIASGVTNGNSHDHNGGDGGQISYTALSNLPTELPPTAHAATHIAAGSDAIKLDDLAAPDDNTDLNASASRHGLLPKLSNITTNYLNGQGSFVTPAATDIGLGNVTNNTQVKKAASSTNGAIPTWSGTTGDALNTGGLAAPSGAIVGTSDIQTLTGKRVSPRIDSTTSAATPTINTNSVDMYLLTAQAGDITSFTTNLSGTPTEGQKLWISITGTAARAITWGSSFESSTVTLPATTVTTNRLDVGFVWNTVSTKWRCIAVA